MRRRWEEGEPGILGKTEREDLCVRAVCNAPLRAI